MSMGNDTGCANLDICVTEPSRANCTLPFKLPHACSVSDATRLCNAMHFMTACSVAKACTTSGADWAKNALGPGKVNVSRSNADICRPFQHIVTVCRLDDGMSKMAGCAHYNTMCVNGSKVDMCSNVTGITALPTTKEVNTQVRSICEAKGAPGCEECMASWRAGKTWGDCDLLSVYSRLCSSSPDMKQCGAWNTMCQADPTLKFWAVWYSSCQV
ncbi:hypothetical protein OEZ86_012126 [Tetradesmus obliquus]|nr:hypothetical protein OEZ86_012126 [Tetradesmus obliquus]